MKNKIYTSPINGVPILETISDEKGVSIYRHLTNDEKDLIEEKDKWIDFI